MDYRSAINAIARAYHKEDRQWWRNYLIQGAITTLAVVYQTTDQKVRQDLSNAIDTIRNEPCPTTSK